MKKNLKSVISFVIALAISLSSVVALAAPSYTDVPADASYAEAVANLTAIGIVEGYGEGKFNPEGKITRAEVAAMVVRALAQREAAESSKGATNFTDIAGDHWASGYINVASRGTAAFINGMGDGTFAPEANVTYAQIIKMLVAGIGYGAWGEGSGGYPTGYIATAKNLGITNNISGINADTEATRAVVAQLINNAIDTPLLSLKTYSPTNPEYVVLDGTGDNDYETVLTYYHNIYKVEGRVTATNQSTGGNLDADQVNFQIELTKNYGPDTLVVTRKDAEEGTNVEKMYVGDTDAADYLNVYAKAIVKVTDSEDPVILAFVASGKNETVSVEAAAIDKENSNNNLLAGGGKGQIYYYANSEKTGKSTRYYVSDDFKLYVNGVAITADATSVNDYIVENNVGNITFVDTPSTGTSSTDGKYDAIFVNYYATAIVNVVQDDTIHFSDFTQADFIDAKLVLDEDNDITYSIKLDGKEIAISDLQEDDVLSVAYDVTTALASSNFYNIIVSRKTVDGKVTALNEDKDGVEIDGNVYLEIDPLTNVVRDTVLGSSYTFNIDAFGRIAQVSKLTSAVKYGIIHRVYEDTATDEYKITIVDAAANLQTYVIAEKLADSSLTALQALADADVEDKVIKYDLNSKTGELRSYEELSKATSGSSNKYVARTGRIGSLGLDESTVIISKGTDKTDYSLVKLSSLLDDATYTAYGYDRDGTYGFVVITSGIGGYVLDTRISVVDTITSAYYNEENRYKVEAYTVNESGVKTLTTLYTEDDALNFSNIVRGDIIVVKLNASGEIEDFDKIFDSTGIAAHSTTTGWNSLLTNVWSDENISDDVELVFGPIIENKKSLVIGKVGLQEINGENHNVSQKGIDADKEDVETGEYVYSIASDVAVYVYNDSRSARQKLSTGVASSAIANVIPKSAIIEVKDGNNNVIEEYINWDAITSTNYVFAKVVENEITDMVVFIPNTSK